VFETGNVGNGFRDIENWCVDEFWNGGIWRGGFEKKEGTGGGGAR
jgi:hypothetical protein